MGKCHLLQWADFKSLKTGRVKGKNINNHKGKVRKARIQIDKHIRKIKQIQMGNKMRNQLFKRNLGRVDLDKQHLNKLLNKHLQILIAKEKVDGISKRLAMTAINNSLNQTRLIYNCKNYKKNTPSIKKKVPKIRKEAKLMIN